MQTLFVSHYINLVLRQECIKQVSLCMVCVPVSVNYNLFMYLLQLRYIVGLLHSESANCPHANDAAMWLVACLSHW